LYLRYLQAEVLHPLLYGGGDGGLGLLQGGGALLAAAQQPGVPGDVHSSSSNGHLGGQSAGEQREKMRSGSGDR